MLFGQLYQRIVTPEVRNVANHWNEARGSRKMPAWSDIKPSAIAEQLPIIWSWRYDLASGKYIGRLAGEKITEAHGANLRGQEAKTFFEGRGGDAMLERMHRVINGPCYYYGEGAVFKHSGRIVTGERAAFPLSEDGETADGILGVTIFEYPKLTEEFGDYPNAETSQFFKL